ncbi:MAG TPA: DedA family protein [Gaiellaceae bacterium]|nr:DedA family protein [Gaiellaceae bacterium]
MLESLTDYVSGSPWTYAFLFAVSALDVVFPIVPSETSVIIAGVLAGQGDLVIWLVIVCSAAGAICGDNLSYGIGRLAGERIVERFFKGERRKRIEWAEHQMAERGPYLIVVGRFIPGGRTAVTLSAGLLEMPWRRFFVFDVLAGFMWASYAALLGYFGGKTFEESPLKAFALAFALALAVSGAIELYRWLKKRRELRPS